MESSSPSPIQQDTGRPESTSGSYGSPYGLSSSHGQETFNTATTSSSSSSSRTGLVTSLNGHSQRSYGTVKQVSSSFKRSSASFFRHHLEEGDTLQGIALRYNVTVQDIQRLNNVWSTDSMFCKPFLKIPTSTPHSSNNSSHSNTPKGSPSSRKRDMDAAPAPSSDKSDITTLSNGLRDLTPSQRLGPEDEEVRSKLQVGRRQRAESITAPCGADGAKSIRDILDCADLQLQLSKDFAEVLAKRSESHNLPKDAYHRTQRDGVSPEKTLPLPVPSAVSNRDTSPRSKRRIHLKRVDFTPDKMQESRDKLEENLFEL